MGTSRRARRVHQGSPTLRAAWSAKGNTRQHSVATLADRYGVPPSGVRDLLVEYLGELKPGMDYASLTGLAYRLMRLIWWEILQINPDQADLRLGPQTITTWRERLAVTSDGRPRREIHSTLFAIRVITHNPHHAYPVGDRFLSEATANVARAVLAETETLKK